MWRGAGPRGMESCAAASSAGAIMALANIAGAVDVDHASSGGGGRFRREPPDGLGDFIGGSDAAQRDVGDDLCTTAALKIFLGHFGHRESGSDRKTEDSIRGISASDSPSHCDHACLGGRIMPVLRRIAAK